MLFVCGTHCGYIIVPTQNVKVELPLWNSTLLSNFRKKNIQNPYTFIHRHNILSLSKRNNVIPKFWQICWIIENGFYVEYSREIFKILNCTQGFFLFLLKLELSKWIPPPLPLFSPSLFLSLSLFPPSPNSYLLPLFIPDHEMYFR